MHLEQITPSPGHYYSRAIHRPAPRVSGGTTTRYLFVSLPSCLGRRGPSIIALLISSVLAIGFLLPPSSLRLAIWLCSLPFPLFLLVECNAGVRRASALCATASLPAAPPRRASPSPFPIACFFMQVYKWREVPLE